MIKAVSRGDGKGRDDGIKELQGESDNATLHGCTMIIACCCVELECIRSLASPLTAGKEKGGE